MHSFLGRIIFTCYLIDRQIIVLQDYSFIRKKGHCETTRSISRITNRNRLGSCFINCSRSFAATSTAACLTMISTPNRKSITDDDIETLKRFFHGDRLKADTARSRFWAYDFSIIPVETISAIYEKFLESEDAEDKEAKDAFYTPKQLAEMVVDEAVGSFDSLLGKKYLDPACGSGIFLAILFNRMACEWRQRNPQAS